MKWLGHIRKFIMVYICDYFSLGGFFNLKALLINRAFKLKGPPRREECESRPLTVFGYALACFLLISISWINPLQADGLILRDNLQRAQPGDFLVILANKTQTLLHIYAKQDPILTIEEIAIPEGKRPPQLSWQEWLNQNAPGNTSWVMYDIDLRTGQMIRYFSFTKRNWFDIPDADNFLSKLLNLRLSKIPNDARKKVGPKPTSGPDWRPTWQPRMTVNGQLIKGVEFDAWRTKWPRDGSELSGKTIEVYVPRDSQRYPSYFPYWLQINGTVGKAKIRIIDSGSQLQSPKPSLSTLLKSA